MHGAMEPLVRKNSADYVSPDIVWAHLRHPPRCIIVHTLHGRVDLLAGRT
jgi:hypothetical protein